MATAVSMVEHGFAVVLYESARILGGRARKVLYRDETLDNGQHILSGAYGDLLRLMNLVGVASDSYVRTPLTIEIPPAFHLQAPRWIAPFHLLAAMISASGLTFAERFAAMRFISRLRARGFQVDANKTVADLFVEYRQPPKVISYLWQPLTVSALNTPVEIASGQVFANVIRDALVSTADASDMLLPRRDLSNLFPEPAAKWLTQKGSEIHPGTRVKAISISHEKLRVETDAAATEFDAVIIAVGPHQLESLTLPLGTLQQTDYQYEPIVTVYLKFDSPVSLAKPMVGQSEGIVQWFFDRRQLMPTMPPPADGLIAAVISASGPHQALSQDDLAASALAELARHTGAMPPLAWHKVVVEKYATFACTPAMQRQRPDVYSGVQGIFFAGDYCAGDYPATLEGAVRNGIRAANAAADYLNREQK